MLQHLEARKEKNAKGGDIPLTHISAKSVKMSIKVRLFEWKMSQTLILNEATPAADLLVSCDGFPKEQEGEGQRVPVYYSAVCSV